MQTWELAGAAISRQCVHAYLSQHDGDARLGLGYELKVKLLVSSIQQRAPANSITDDQVALLTNALQAPAQT